jgi:hypothetical protein
MMQVYAMPPVSYTTHSQALENPRTNSTGLNGTIYTSQYRKSRRQIQTTIHGIGDDHSGQGYVEQLRRYLDENAPLVQFELRPNIWTQKIDVVRAARGHGEIQWDYTEVPFEWLYTEQHLNIFYSGMDVVADVDYGGNYLDVVVPTPNADIAMAGEIVVQGSVTGRVVGVARSDASGNARIYVDTEFQTGHVQISPPEWVTCYVTDMPATSETNQVGFEYTMSMIEVLPQDYPDGLEVIQPWR